MSAVEAFAARILTQDNRARGEELNYLFSTEADAIPNIEELRAWAKTYLLQNYSATLSAEQYQMFVRAFTHAHGLVADQRNPLYTTALRIQDKYYLPVSDGDVEGIYNYFSRITGVYATPQGFLQFLRDLA